MGGIMPNIFYELPNGTKSYGTDVITIGKHEPSGMRHGAAVLDKEKPLTFSVNDAGDGAGFWSAKFKEKLRARAGTRTHRMIDVSGHWGRERPTNEYIEALRDALDGYVLNERDIIWGDLEYDDPETLAEKFWAICESGVAGNARLVCHFVSDGRRPMPCPTFRFPRVRGACDRRTSYLPAMVEYGRDPVEHLAWLRSSIKSMRDAGYQIMAHVRGGKGGPVRVFPRENYESDEAAAQARSLWDRTQPYTPAEREHYGKIARLLIDEKVETVLVYNIFGQGPLGVTTNEDGTPHFDKKGTGPDCLEMSKAFRVTVQLR